MIINRNIKASGAILVCDNPHTLVSTNPNLPLPWQRWRRNYVSPSCRYRVSLHVISLLTVATWHVDDRLLGSYIRKESPVERARSKASQNPPTTHTHTHTAEIQWLSDNLSLNMFEERRQLEGTPVEKLFFIFVLKTASMKRQGRATVWRAQRSGTCGTNPSLQTGNINVSL